MATEATLQVTGMDCAACARRLGNALQRMEGVITASVDPAGPATVRYEEARLDEEALAQRVRAVGFDVA